MVREGWSWSGREANCAYLNLGDGSFLDISRVAGTDDADDGRAFAKVDWDNDGDLDMWVANRTAPQIRFLRNDVGNRSNFVEFQLTGTDVNRDAVGARVELLGDSQNLVRVLQAGTGFLSQSSNRLHFGTGDRTLIDEVLVRWPDGSEERFHDVQTNQRYAITQGEGLLHLVEPSDRNVSLSPSEPVPTAPSENANLGLTWRIPFPAVTATSFAGERFDLATQGRPTLVNLWASWCPTCREELNTWNAAREQIEEANLQIIALSVDEVPQDAADNPARTVARELQPWFPMGMADQELISACEAVQTTLVDRNRNLPVPTSFLIDHNGKIARIYKGPVSLDEMLADVSDMRYSGLKAASAAVPFDGRWHGGPQLPGILNLVDRLAQTGEAKRATPYLEMTLGIASGMPPGHADSRQLAARITRFCESLRAQGDMDLARRWLLSSRDLDPYQPLVWKALAEDATTRGEPAEAAAYLERWVSLDASSAEAWSALAVAQDALGDEAAAQVSRQRATALR